MCRSVENSDTMNKYTEYVLVGKTASLLIILHKLIRIQRKKIDQALFYSFCCQFNQ